MRSKVSTFETDRSSGIKAATPLARALQPLADAIADTPTDPVTWLVLADWLAETVSEDCAAFIRWLWVDTAPPAYGSVSRGYYQWENGGRSWQGVGVGYDADNGWHHSYWSNGNWLAKLGRNEARQLISSAGKPWRFVRVEPWTGARLVSEGVQKYTGLTISGGA